MALASIVHSITSLPEEFRTAIEIAFLVNIHPDILHAVHCQSLA
jgi:hypothetical protein